MGQIIKMLLFIFFLISCSKKENHANSSELTIISFSPAEGTEGTRVTINGRNFRSNTKENIITIGSVNTEPVSATWSQMIFNIPAGVTPGSYPIKVEVGNVSSISLQLFNVKDKEVAITDPDVLNFNYSIGTQTIGPSYGFTASDRLVESAKAILEMGSNILKISLTPGSYNISGRSYNNITSLVRDDPSFREVLNMPFTYYFFWARSNSNWADGYSIAERTEDSLQIADLTTYLLTKFNNTGKQFFLGHWEGDWYLLPNYDATYIPSDGRLNGMIQWYKTRQNAVDEAKKVAIYNNVEVFSYCEVNRVVDAMNGLRRVVNYVLPYTNVDYVSYSSYDSQGLNQTEYNNVLNFIEGNLPTKPQIIGKRVFIGEMGRCSYDLGSSKSLHESVNRENIRKAVLWGAPFILYWEMYNNEIANGIQKGFWLIDNTGIKWPLYDTYFNFYTKAKHWVLNQKKTLNRLPTREEYMSWAYSTLANP